jgi:ketosteroid isomerase-like protein
MLIALAAATIFAAASCASTTQETAAVPAPSITGNSESTEDVIANLEREWARAIVQKDAATIDRLLADDFGGTTNSEVYSKEQAIADLTTGVHEMLELDNINVRVFGDVAVATMGQTEKSRHDNEDFSGRYLFTNVWVKTDGQWRAVASHGSRVR